MRPRVDGCDCDADIWCRPRSGGAERAVGQEAIGFVRPCGQSWPARTYSALVITFLVGLVALTIAAALLIDADGANHPATIAGVMAAVRGCPRRPRAHGGSAQASAAQRRPMTTEPPIRRAHPPDGPAAVDRRPVGRRRLGRLHVGPRSAGTFRLSVVQAVRHPGRHRLHRHRTPHGESTAQGPCAAHRHRAGCVRWTCRRTSSDRRQCRPNRSPVTNAVGRIT